MVGLGLGGFILMDVTSSQGMLGGGRVVMAEVAGEKIDINEFNSLEQTVYGNSGGDPYARRNALWSYYLEKILLEKEAEAIGIGVSKEELLDLQFGTNLSPVIQRNFSDPNTGQVDRNRLMEFKTAIENNTLEASLRPFWAYQEKDIIRERLKEKMISMMYKGMYVPTWMAEMIAEEQNAKADFLFARIPFTAIQDSEVTLSDADYKAYLAENAPQFQQKEPVRRIEYVVFDVVPSQADSQSIYKQMEEIAEAFSLTDDDSLFIQNNFGVIDGAYYKKGEIASAIADTVFNVLVETVIGPYEDAGAYRVVKVLDRKMLPDSVRSRHILVRADMTNQLEIQRAFQTLDSLRNLIKGGTESFEALAAQFGQDGSAAQGGDLGFAGPNMMVKPFNDLIFYEAEPDSLYIIGTQFGVHLVEVTDKKFINNEQAVRLGFVSMDIIPSEETERSIEREAIVLVTENNTLAELRTALASRSDVSFQTSPPLPRNAFFIPNVGSGQSARDIVRWAFGDDPSFEAPKVGDICKDVFTIQATDKFYTEQFVIAGLKSVQKAGSPALETVKDEIEQAVLNKKKASMIMERLGRPASVQEAASKFGVAVDTVRNVSFSAGTAPNLGNEPLVVATAFRTEVNATSAPVTGNSGVYVVAPTVKPPVSTSPNLALTRRTMAMTLRSQVEGRLIDFLKEKEGVDDNRANFF